MGVGKERGGSGMFVPKKTKTWASFDDPFMISENILETHPLLPLLLFIVATDIRCSVSYL